MAKARELKRRIRSISSTRQITKTMEMVATSRLKKAQDRVVAARPYAAALAEVIGDLYAPELAERFPLLRRPAEDRAAPKPTAGNSPATTRSFASASSDRTTYPGRYSSSFGRAITAISPT